MRLGQNRRGRLGVEANVDQIVLVQTTFGDDAVPPNDRSTARRSTMDPRRRLLPGEYSTGR